MADTQSIPIGFDVTVSLYYCNFFMSLLEIFEPTLLLPGGRGYNPDMTGGHCDFSLIIRVKQSLFYFKDLCIYWGGGRSRGGGRGASRLHIERRAQLGAVSCG